MSGSKECPIVFAYFGGKYEVSKKFVPMIPPHKHYIELFAGGLSIFFRKKKAEWSLVNDLNMDIANLYYVLSIPDMYDEFVERAFWLVHSRVIYNKYRDILKTEFEIPNIERAVVYYYYISNCFNQQIGTDYSDKISNWTTSFQKNLRLSREKLDGVIVESKDYKYIIDRYAEKQDTFWYIDPPYWVTQEEEYYKFNFTRADHYTLKEYIDKIVKNSTAKIMISYDNIDEIKELYSKAPYIINEVKMVYASNGKTVTELLITNYTASEQITLFS